MHRRSPSTSRTAATAALVAALATACAPVAQRTIRTFAVTRPTSTAEAFAVLSAPAHQATLVLIDDNVDAWVARWRMLDSAHGSIDGTTFIMEPDVYGFAFLGRLLEKARRGVQVRLLVDGRGAPLLSGPLLGRDYLEELAASRHAQVRIYNPPIASIPAALASASLVPVMASNHDKILVVDGALALFGGRNVARAYFADPRDDELAYEDTDVMVSGPGAVGALAQSFDLEFGVHNRDDVAGDVLNGVPRDAELMLVARAMDVWLSLPALSDAEAAVLAASPTRRRDEAIALEARAARHVDARLDWASRVRARPILLQLVAETRLRGAAHRPQGAAAPVVTRTLDKQSRMGMGRDAIGPGLAALVDGARARITLQSPTLALTPAELGLLARAARRGVAIDVLTNSSVSSDNIAANAVFLADWPEILAAVPTMRLFVTGGSHQLHNKRAVFDEDITLIGTYNLDPFSYSINGEVVAAISSRAFATQNLARMNARVEQPDVVEYRIRRDASGRAMRWPRGDPRAGEVVVAFGPADHVPAATPVSFPFLHALLWVTQSLFDTRSLR